MGEIILFGIGRECKRYIGILHMLGMKASYLTDNDPQKWGTEIEGIRVIEPNALKIIKGDIIISCNFVKEITAQLEEMGIGDRILNILMLIRKRMDEEINTYADITDWRTERKTSEQIIVDAFDGIGWGGMEIWSYTVAKELRTRGYSCMVYGSSWQKRQKREVEEFIKRFELDREDYMATVKRIYKDMESRMPFLLINNWSEHVLAAAYMLKKKYPEEVRIISVVHNDSVEWYEKQKVWGDCAEKIAGVSRRICDKLSSYSGIPEEKIVYHENFYTGVPGKEPLKREKSDPLKIGWGARLEIQQKRADLLPRFIEELEKTKITYVLDIAGDGPYRSALESYVAEKGIENRVKIWGSVPSGEMTEYWKKHHIYLNISEYEGCSLAMLDAMAQGCVPVVSNVSGTDEFIENGKNGWREEIGNFASFAERIKYLYDNENKRKQMGEDAIGAIVKKCNPEAYLDYIEDLIKSNN